MASGTPDLIRNAVERLQAEVPAFENLKLVFALELRGRGDTQHYRVEVPGPKISKGVPEDARLTVSIARPQFNDLAREGKVNDYRKAFERGHLRVEGDPRVQRLIATVVAKHESRAGVKRVH